LARLFPKFSAPTSGLPQLAHEQKVKQTDDHDEGDHLRGNRREKRRGLASR